MNHHPRFLDQYVADRRQAVARDIRLADRDARALRALAARLLHRLADRLEPARAPRPAVRPRDARA